MLAPHLQKHLKGDAPRGPFLQEAVFPRLAARPGALEDIEGGVFGRLAPLRMVAIVRHVDLEATDWQIVEKNVLDRSRRADRALAPGHAHIYVERTASDLFLPPGDLPAGRYDVQVEVVWGPPRQRRT